MKKRILETLVILLGASNIGLACDELGKTGIVPENNMYISVDAKSVSTITKMQFTQVLDRVERIYKPIVQSLGKRLVIQRKWDDGTVNAYAQQKGNMYHIAMYGGLARHRAVTADGFALVACHEMGHHLGGLPKKRRSRKTTWATNEGQADYFGTMKCLRKYMEKDDNMKMVRAMKVPAIVTSKCRKQFNHPQEIAICQRGSMAGLSLASLFKDLRKLPAPLKFGTPDKKVVWQTNDGHPAPQCRLDTYFAGALCEEDQYTDMSNRDIHQGVCSRKFNKVTGVRPLCWFKPSK